MKAIIVDDEQHAIDLFKQVLNLFENKLEIIGEASNLPECIKLITQLKPDVVFLDIDMPKYSGIQIKDFFDDKKDFKLIFVTAHGQYAIDALRINAFDYLLKPIDADALSQCYKRLISNLSQSQNAPLVENEVKKIAINSHQGTLFLNVDDINFVEASSVYCIVNTDQGNQIIVSKPLGEFQKQLDNSFYRVHRSYLVNAKKIIKYSNKEDSEIELVNGKRIPVSRNQKENFKKFMKLMYGIL